MRRSLATLLVAGLVACGGEDAESTADHAVRACAALDEMNEETKAGGSIDAAGVALSEATDLALDADDRELRSAAEDLQNAGDSTADLAIALTDMSLRCDELGL